MFRNLRLLNSFNKKKCICEHKLGICQDLLEKLFHIFINAEIYITFRTDGCLHVGKLVHGTDSVIDWVCSA